MDGLCGPVAAAHGARFVRIQASGYREPEGLLAHWQDTAQAAVRAVRARSASDVVATQGTTLTVADLERTLVCKAVVHHLDVLLDLPDAPPPCAECLWDAHELLGELVGESLPSDDVQSWVLRACGRLPVPAAWADRLPVLG